MNSKTLSADAAIARYPPLTPFEHYEHGKDADPTFPNLLKGATLTDVTGNIGAEVHGVQLSKLSNAGKDELALFVAQKKVVGRLPSFPPWLKTRSKYHDSI